MTKIQVQIVVIAILVSFSLSFSHKECFKMSGEVSGSSSSSPKTTAEHDELEAFWEKLRAAGAPVAQVLSTKSYVSNRVLCKIYFMNLYDITSEQKHLINSITTSFSKLYDSLVKVNFLSTFLQQYIDIMYEPSTNRLVFYDILSIMIQHSRSSSARDYKDYMDSRLKESLSFVRSDKFSDKDNSLTKQVATIRSA